MIVELFSDYWEKRKQRRKARAAFYAYARNGWQSPWIRKNRWLDSILHR